MLGASEGDPGFGLALEALAQRGVANELLANALDHEGIAGLGVHHHINDPLPPHEDLFHLEGALAGVVGHTIPDLP
jgi:hypothetical protein